MAYDERRGSVVMFGGYNRGADTWLYAPEVLATYDPFGAGCAGTAGTPRLSAAPGERPWLGEPFVVELAQLPPSAPVALSFGISKTVWQGVSLPLSLAALGLPQCLVLASPDIVVPLGAPSGTASFTLPLCACPSLLGATYYNQGFVLEPTGLLVSNAAMAVVGGK